MFYVFLIYLCTQANVDKFGCGLTNQEIRIVGGRPTGVNVSKAVFMVK